MTTFERVRDILRDSFRPTAGPGTVWPLFWFSFKSILLSRKKTPLLLLFLMIPLALTLMLASTLDDYTPQGDDVTSAYGGRAWFQDILSQVFFPLLIPIVTAAYATAVIGEEVEGKTLPYVFTRPVYRNWIVISKSAAFLLASAILGIVAVTATYFVAVSITEDPFRHVDELFGYWSAVGLTIFATGGLFLLLGVSMKPAMILIATYTFVWETFFSNLIPSSILKYSFVWYERAYINSFIGREAGFGIRLLVDVPGPTEAAMTLLVVGVVGFLSSLVVVSMRDYNV
ncbi:MAG: ABC transporter permease subunit [Euryarchaeota archaeon]|nr:ABC transporter permease subunit [Euryarchaeota archaeon]